MASSTTIPKVDNFAELLDRLGNVPLERILMHPAPGTATEEDALLLLEALDKRLVELIDGVLVEKPTGTREGFLGGLILQRILNYLDQNPIAEAAPGDSALRLQPGLVRIPDVSVIGSKRIPDGFPPEALASLVPDLAIEVISQSNTRGEIKRKLKDYFLSGTQLAWVIYPKTQTAEVYTAPDRKKRIARGGTLDGSSVLPGFTLSLSELFARAARKLRHQ
jgi:Uma2 family endonuclease